MSQRHRIHRVRASSSDETDVIATDIPEPEDARGAIAVSLDNTAIGCRFTTLQGLHYRCQSDLHVQVGLEQYNSGAYETALGIFEKAMDLPGTGIKQFRCKPSTAACKGMSWQPCSAHR